MGTWTLPQANKADRSGKDRLRSAVLSSRGASWVAQLDAHHAEVTGRFEGRMQAGEGAETQGVREMRNYKNPEGLVHGVPAGV